MLFLILGNIFALIASLCVIVSAVKNNKKDLIGWQTAQISFCIFSNIVLFAYAALCTNCIALIRNMLAYRNRLTPKKTILLSILCIVVGWYVNNLGMIGWLAIAASTIYTILMFIAKNDQQMRYAMLIHITLWLIHDYYIQSYPTVISSIGLFVWTIIQIFYNDSKKRKI